MEPRAYTGTDIWDARFCRSDWSHFSLGQSLVRRASLMPCRTDKTRWFSQPLGPDPRPLYGSRGDVIARVLFKHKPPVPFPCARVEFVSGILEGDDAPLGGVCLTHQAVECGAVLETACVCLMLAKNVQLLKLL